MKMKTMYEIRSYTGTEYSRVLGRKLRTPTSATKLVNRLRKGGVDAFKVKCKIAA